MKLGCCPPFGWVHCNLTNSRVDLVIDQIEIRAVCLPALVWLLSHTRVDKSNHSTEKWRQDKQHCCCCSQANLRGYRIKCTRQQSNSLSVVFFFSVFLSFPTQPFLLFLGKMSTVVKTWVLFCCCSHISWDSSLIVEMHMPCCGFCHLIGLPYMYGFVQIWKSPYTAKKPFLCNRNQQISQIYF